MSSAVLLRFGAFGDAHYADKVYGDRHCQDAVAKLDACISDLNDEALALVVCLGDLIDSADDPNIEAGHVRTMAGHLARFRGPRHFVLGNHDISGMAKGDFLRWCGAEAPAWYSFDERGVHFVVLDGNCHEDGRDFDSGDFSWDQAWVSEAQITWLRRDLAGARGPVVVLCHENLDHRLWQGQLDPHVARNAAQVRAVLEQAGSVCAVVQAHYHPGLLAVQQGIAYISLRAMVVGPGPANTSYAVVAVHDDGRVIVEGRGQQDSFVGAGPEG